jgi:hypothetical protein
MKKQILILFTYATLSIHAATTQLSRLSSALSHRYVVRASVGAYMGGSLYAYLLQDIHISQLEASIESLAVEQHKHIREYHSTGARAISSGSSPSSLDKMPSLYHKMSSGAELSK